ncbi:MAG TPA: phosphotransferase [Saprospiraceae bacterium]|nr:phosphotransferase [Saprospiraceae bacterium]
MNKEIVHELVNQGLFPGPATSVSLMETHISWVVLTEQYAFKLKKPVQFDFLDFSTLAQRKYFCEEEFRLNSRLAPQMYIGVVPVTEKGIGSSEGTLLDYAVQMHRMDNQFEMDKMLLEGRVTEQHMTELAQLLAAFHKNHRLPADHAYLPEADIHDFADLFAFKEDLFAILCPDAAHLLHSWEKAVPAFLEAQTPHQAHRLTNGFWVDGHGDLHSRNIFLPPEKTPVVFDCLEFNPHLRQTDVLNELAFLCMDLEFYAREDLAEVFLTTYVREWTCFERLEDDLLFTYFKAYRANVRLKVALLGLRQHADEELVKAARSYWALLRRYMLDLVGF